MEVAFWSNIGGKNAVTSNLAGISVMLALEKNCQSVLFENHCHMMNLEKMFVRRRPVNLLREEENYFYNHVGMDSLIKMIHSNLYSEDIFTKSSLNFLNRGISYIPQSRLVNKELFEYELNQVIEGILEYMEEISLLTFIDTAGCDNLSTKVILSKADLVVINLSQDPQIIDHFFENYSSLTSKAVYLLGNYDHNSKFNLINIRRKYHINKEKIAVIPHSAAFRDSIMSGDIISFLLHNQKCKKDDENYYFIKELKKAANMIYLRLNEQSPSFSQDDSKMKRLVSFE